MTKLELSFSILTLLLIRCVAAEDHSNSSFLCKDNQYSYEECRPLQPKEIDTLRTFRKQESSILTNPYNGTRASNFKVYIYVLVPFDNCYVFSKDNVKPAIYQALEDANATLCANTSQANVRSKEVCYEITFKDTKCDAQHTLEQVVHIRDKRFLLEQCENSGYNLENDLDIFLGSSCDYAANGVSSLASIWNWPVVFPGTRSIVFANKSEPCCTTLTRTGHDATNFGRFINELYTTNVFWNSSYLLYTAAGSDRTSHGAPIHFDSISDCSTLMEGVITTSEAYDLNFVSYESFISDEYVMNNAENILRDLATKTRVSLWCVGRKAMRSVMNTASRLGMTSGKDPDFRFAFFYIDLYNGNTSYSWTNEDDFPCEEMKQTSGDSSDGMEALQVVTLYRPETATFRNFSNNMKVKSYAEGNVIVNNQEFISPYITEYYNAIRLIVNGVSRSIEDEPQNFRNGSTFASKLWNTTFESIDGTVTITENGDQLMNYVIMDYDSGTKQFERSTIYYGINDTWVVLKSIDWPGQEPPESVPPCGSFECPELSATQILLIVLFITLILCLMMVFYIGKRMVEKERKVREMAWNVKYEDIVFNRRNGRRISGESETVELLNGSGLLNGVSAGQRFPVTATWNGQVVAVKQIDTRSKIHVNRELKVEMDQMLSLNHEHICRFIGACIRESVIILTEYCSRGSLKDFLKSGKITKLDDMFRNSLISDISNGMYYLHKSPIEYHGNLKSSNCLLDSRFVIKLADFGLFSFRQQQRRNSRHNYYNDLLWTAPELLRLDHDRSLTGTQKGDVYSFAIIAQEILFSKGPYYLGVDVETMSPDEICRRLEMHSDPPFRPTLEDDDDVVVGSQMRAMVNECWRESPERRPTFGRITAMMNTFNKKQNLFDGMVSRLEKYSSTLEEKVEEKTMQYKAEKERTDALLDQMLPRQVANILKNGGKVAACKFDCVTIYFSDIVGFTAISHKSSASQVVTMLHDLYTVFDRVVAQYDVYKVETIGDAYMMTSGLPEKNGNRHVREIARTALDLMTEIKSFGIPHMPSETLKIRVGIHSGPVVAGVAGKKMPRYCLFGDTVNTAARMEQSGESLKIQLSPATKELLENFGTFVMKERQDLVFLKGLGKWKTWWLEGEKTSLNESFSFKTFHRPLSIHKWMTGSKKISNHTSDYGSARSSEADAALLPVTGAEDKDYFQADIKNGCSEPTRSASMQSDLAGDDDGGKRRRTAISMQGDEAFVLTKEISPYWEKQREQSFGYLPSTPANLQFNEGYSSSQTPITTPKNRKLKPNSFSVV